MPKVVESKLIFKSEDRGMKANIDSITAAIERLGSAVEKTAKQFEAMAAAMAGMTGGKTFAMKGGSGRSPNAPPPEEAETRKKPKDKGLYPGWHSGFRFAGAMMGAAGGVIGGMAHQVTPAIGGMLSAAGGALSSVSVAGIPVGALPGLGLMAAGGLLTTASLVAQPAMQHYGQFADTYRLLGEDKANQMRDMMTAGGFKPDEAMKYGATLHKIGALGPGGVPGFGAAGTMTQLRYGPASPEMLSQYFTGATTAGAAGGRTKQEYDFLAKLIYSGVNKDKGKMSMEQSIETMTSLMGISSDYLGDLTNLQSKQLAALTIGMEGAGTAAWRGPKGVQAFQTVAAKMAGVGSTPEEMYKFEVWRQKTGGKGGYRAFRMWGGNPTESVRDVLTYMANRRTGIYEAEKMFGWNPNLGEKRLATFRKGTLDKTSQDETMRLLTKDTDKNTPLPKFKATGTSGVFTAESAAAATAQLAASSKIMADYMKTETKLITDLTAVFSKMPTGAALKMFSDAVDTFVAALGVKEGTPEEKEKEQRKAITTLQSVGLYLTPGSPALIEAIIKFFTKPGVQKGR